MEQRNKMLSYVLLGGSVLFLVVWAAMGKMVSPLSSKGFGMWFAAFLTICILSFLYDDNPFYKFAESLFVGVSAAYFLVLGFWESIVKNLLAVLTPNLVKAAVPVSSNISWGKWLWYLIPLVLGIFLLLRLAPRIGWISRWPLAVIVGWTAGTNLVRYLDSDFTKQISPMFQSLIVYNADNSINWMSTNGTLGSIVMVGGVLCALIYFFFSVEHKGVFGHVSKVGIWVLMITFGAAFGYTVMGRVALLVGRMEFLFVDFLKLISS
jgi:hypothetical protein